MNFLIWGDPHLNQKEDLEKYSDLDVAVENYDAMFVVGDVVDPIPRDRESGDSIIDEDKSTGRAFYRIFNQIGEQHGIPTFTVPGNHDHDIHDLIVEDFEHVNNVKDSMVRLSEVTDRDISEDYTIVGNGARQFDLRPEIDYPKYESLNPGHEDSYSLEEIEDMLNRAVDGQHGQNELIDIFDISRNQESEFIHEYTNFINVHGSLTPPEKYSDTNTIYLSHIGAFNTSNDLKHVHELDDDLHYGSMGLKTAIKQSKADLLFHGHNHNEHGFDYLSHGDNDETYIIDPGKSGITEVSYDDGSFTYRDLTE